MAKVEAACEGNDEEAVLYVVRCVLCVEVDIVLSMSVHSPTFISSRNPKTRLRPSGVACSIRSKTPLAMASGDGAT